MKFCVNKNVVFLLMFISPSEFQASPLGGVAAITSGCAAVYPQLKETCLCWKLFENREAIIAVMDDVDPVVEDYTRSQLSQKMYDSANILPIKMCDDAFTLETQLGKSLVFSKQYQAEIKEKLFQDNTEEKKHFFGNLHVELDHEMFHLHDQHALQSLRAKCCIPLLVELVLLPLTFKLATADSFKASAMLVGMIPLKRWACRHIEYAHKRHQEQRADTWAFNNTTNIDELTACINYRTRVVRQGFAELFIEYASSGASSSWTFNMLMKLFNGSSLPTLDGQRLDTDPDYAAIYVQKMKELYEKYEQQPLSWPLRLLQYEFDPEHPFFLDSVAQIKARIESIRRSQK